MLTRILPPLIMLCLLAEVWSTCPVPVLDGNNETQLIFLTPMKLVTNDTLQDCDKSVQHILMEGLGIEEVTSNTFGDFYNLKYLSLAYNNITVLSSVLLDYKRGLVSFKINNNRLERIENGTFKHLDNVQYIDIQFNNINYIAPEAFPKNLRLLYIVNASYNALTYMEPWPYLPETDPDNNDDVIFDLKHNYIREFRNSVNWTYNLVSPYEYDINLSFNNITTQMDDVMKTYHPGFEGNTAVEFISFRINASNNPYFCDCTLYSYAAYLHESAFYFYNKYEFRFQCEAPDSLRGIDFMHDLPLDQFVCNLTENCPAGCLCQEQPHRGHLLVDCSLMGGNSAHSMDRLPLRLPTSKLDKISLHLDGHYITRLEQRDYLPKLVNLTLGWNKLTYIEPSVLKSMSGLEYLDISHNRLNYVPKDIQYFTTENVRIDSNPFVCDCNMTWMAVWVSLYLSASAYHAKCSNDGDRLYIRDISKNLLCDYGIIITIVAVVIGILIALIIGAVVTAQRCPYETKVLMYRLLGLHPADKYRVDREESHQYDIYLSHYEHDLQARQWVRSKFLRKLEENQKRKYKVFYSERDPLGGSDKYDELITNMRKCRRIIFLLTNEFFDDEKSIFEADQAEIEHFSSDNLHGRVIYILWNESVRAKLKADPWKSRVEGKRVLCPDEKLFWSKIRYELPIKLLPPEQITDDPKTSNWAQGKMERAPSLKTTQLFI